MRNSDQVLDIYFVFFLLSNGYEQFELFFEYKLDPTVVTLVD